MSTPDITELRLDCVSWQCLETMFGGLLLRPKTIPDRDFESEEEFEQIVKQFEGLREEVRACLENSPEVSEVSDLFDEEKEKGIVKFDITHRGRPVSRNIPPLICVLQLPARFQRIAELFPGERTDRFVLVLDGTLMFISGLTSRGHLRGFQDARDKIAEILCKGKCSSDFLAPNTARVQLDVVNGPESTFAPPSTNSVLRLNQSCTVKAAMKETYSRLYFPLLDFYWTRKLTAQCNGLSEKIADQERAVLKGMREFFSVKSHQILKRRSICSGIRVGIVALLEMLSEHSSLSTELKQRESDFERRLSNYDLARELLEKTQWRDFTRPENVDRPAVLSIADHARSEMQTYSVASVTVWAGLVSAVVASAVTFLIYAAPTIQSVLTKLLRR